MVHGYQKWYMEKQGKYQKWYMKKTGKYQKWYTQIIELNLNNRRKSK